MTAEVAVLNKTAVALAADSAATLGPGKTYPAHKLFALSKHHPVGLMVYNNAEFMGVPWETVVKMFRRSCGSRSYATVREYLTAFIEFVGKPPFYTAEQEAFNVGRIVSAAFEKVIRRGVATADATRLKVAIEQEMAAFRAAGPSEALKGVNLKRLRKAYEPMVDSCIDGAFPPNVAVAAKAELHALAAEAVQSASLSEGHSGVVVAGFGEDEVFPSLVEIVTDGCVGGRVKYSSGRSVDIGRPGPHAMIIPFAQGDMVARFMEGVDPAFLDYVRSAVAAASFDLAMELLKASGASAVAEKEDTLRRVALVQAEQYLTGAFDERIRDFIEPVMEAVRHLPKEELAELAEALVNLTALKRRVSLQSETVAGPVDVAVISKGDGLIWIKRKRYFDPALNHR